MDSTPCTINSKREKSRSFYSSGGFSLIEMLFYVALLSLSLIMVIHTLVILVRSHGVQKAGGQIEEEASLALDRMLREIRDASSIDDAGSTLGTTNGKLLLTTTTVDGTLRTVEFSLGGGKLYLKEDGGAQSLLAGGKTTISGLTFKKVSTAHSQGATIDLAISGGTGSSSRTEHFYATAVLRDSY